MRKYWWLIILFFLGLFLGPKLKQLDGFVVFALDKTTAQIPMWLGIIIILLIIVIFHILINFIQKSVGAVSQARAWSGSRKWKKARTLTISGMIAFTEGRWEKAEKHMQLAAKEGDTKLINYLIAAEAAQKVGDFEKRAFYLKKCKQVAPDKDFAIELTQARLQLESNQYEEAQSSLRHLLEMEPENNYVLTLYTITSDKLKNWDQVINTYHKIKKKNKELDVLYINAINNNLILLSQNSKNTQIEQIWKNLPAKIKKQPEPFNCYIQALINVNEQEKAEKLLKKQLKTSENLGAIKLFASIESKQPGKQLDLIESKMLLSNNKAEILEVLVDLSIKLKLWGKARQFIEQSLEIESTAVKQLKLAKVLKQLGELEQAKKIRDGLLEI
ncbi:MAG TPA: hypothetical protein ENJ60_03180 [Aeromonadales bacterium]|nr:hypothetical protein [Aeromonadales bacterium]